MRNREIKIRNVDREGEKKRGRGRRKSENRLKWEEKERRE
jgi:hypothetical protein